MAELKLLTEQRSSDANVLPYAHGFYGNWGVFRGCDRLSPEIEYPENASRSPALANKLQACIDNPVGGTALRITCDFALSSSEGDEFGVSVEEDPAIRNRSSNRIIGLAQRALSGFTLEDYWQIVWRFLAWGDCFASVVEDDGGRLRPLLLPTWQVHLESDEWSGEITRAYQRRPRWLARKTKGTSTWKPLYIGAIAKIIYMDDRSIGAFGMRRNITNRILRTFRSPPEKPR